jgi:peptidyl-tRNA hydrolase
MRKTILIGLGNPGEEYADTYHNAGWKLLDFLKEKLDEIKKREFTIQYHKQVYKFTLGDINRVNRLVT